MTQRVIEPARLKGDRRQNGEANRLMREAYEDLGSGTLNARGLRQRVLALLDSEAAPTSGALVMLSPFGFSHTGEAFNLSMEDVATSAAIALKADKLIFVTEVPGIRLRPDEPESDDNPIDTELPLAESLARQTRRPVVEAADGTPLQRGNVYVAPGGKHLVIRSAGGSLAAGLNEQPPENGCRPSADVLFRSAAAALGGLSGVLIGLYSNAVFPLMGQPMLHKGIAVIILGGLGDIRGAMLGGLFLGFAEVLSVAYIGSTMRDAVAFGFLIVVLLFRPEGLIPSRRRKAELHEGVHDQPLYDVVHEGA